MKFLKWYVTNDYFIVILDAVLIIANIIFPLILAKIADDARYLLLFLVLPVTIMPIVYVMYRMDHKDGQ